jgi:ABC-type lipoprotein release transport system permease subunit
MIFSRLVWKMAVSHLTRHWRQTLLTLVAGVIGAMLITVSVVNYESVKRSGQNWLEQRLGAISWKVTPDHQSAFTPDQLKVMDKYTKQFDHNYRFLPYVTTEVSVVHSLDQQREGTALSQVLLMGFSMQAASMLEGETSVQWPVELADNEVIVNRRMAEQLKLKEGDVLEVTSSRGSRKVQVRMIVEERGLSGYRESGTQTATIIGAEPIVRELAGLEADGHYPAVLIASVNPQTNPQALLRIPDLSWQPHYLKVEAQQKIAKMDFTYLIGLISLVAIVTSLLFMRQVLLMIADSRTEIYGTLRAIGLSRRHIFSMFLVEGSLLSLLSALAGVLLGVVASYGLIHWLYGNFAEVLQRLTSDHIPINPHFTLATGIWLLALIWLVLLLTAAVAARKASKLQIVAALRGNSFVKSETTIGRKLLTTGLVGFGVLVTVKHIRDVFILTPNPNDPSILPTVAAWLGTCFTVLFLLIYFLRLMEKPLHRLLHLLGVPKLSLRLAIKYPWRELGRTYTTSLLFALVMLTITFTANLNQIMDEMRDVEHNEQTILGFGGYATYQTDEERRSIEQAAAVLIQGQPHDQVVIEPFMIQFLSDSTAQAIVPVTKPIVQSGIELLGRSSEFSTDQAAWERVANNQQYIILPHYYMGQYIAGQAEGVKAGDTITLPVLESGLILEGKQRQVMLEKEFVIAGFAPDKAKNMLIDLYGATYVNPKIAQELKEYGFKWPNQSNKGIVLFRFDYKNIKLSQQLEEQFLLHQVHTFKVPYLSNSAEQLMYRQMGNGFIGFTILSAFIGLLGLSVIQFRAVRERSKEVAMMRCIGISNRIIYYMFLTEGVIISVAGLVAGWLIGSTGAYLTKKLFQVSRESFQESLTSGYPYVLLSIVFAALLLTSIGLNTAPARAALSFKAADALRKEA